MPAAIGLTWGELLIAAATVPAMLATLFLQGILLGEAARSPTTSSRAHSRSARCSLWPRSLRSGPTVASALTVVLGWHAGAALVFLVLLRSDTPKGWGPDLRLVLRMASYAGRIYVSGMIAYAVIRIDVLLVNGYLGAAEAGYYALAVSLVDMLYVIPLVVAVNLFPRVARVGGVEMSALVFRVVALPYALMCLVAAVLAGTIFEVLYGSEFAPSTRLFWWLAPGAFCAGCSTFSLPLRWTRLSEPDRPVLADRPRREPSDQHRTPASGRHIHRIAFLKRHICASVRAERQAVCPRGGGIPCLCPAAA